MPPLRTIIIDDEKLARQELTYLLSQIHEIELIAECAYAEDAKEKIELLKPDLIFLDIEMPEKNGFELLQELKATPYVIFSTAYDGFALKAFEENALDYLLKPTTLERLQKAINKASKIINNQKSLNDKLHKKIFVKDGQRTHCINLYDIYLLEAAGNYTHIYYLDKKCMIHKTLKQMETSLPSDFFIRINRQQIVNLQTIHHVESHYHGGLTLTIAKNKTVEVSQRNAVSMKRIMKI